jgi:hypothetical protein
MGGRSMESEARNLNARSADEPAQQAAEYALSQLAQAEGLWRSALSTLTKQPAAADAERLIQSLLIVFESGRQLVRSARALSAAAELQTSDALNAVEERFNKLAAEATRALQHRTNDWQPADPERLAEGLKLARESQTVTADKARAWFRRG